MNKKKRKFTYRYFAAVLVIAILLGFLVYKDQLKITVVNSFSDAYADNVNYHVLDESDSSMNSMGELAVSGRKTFIFVTSSWCSLCDALSIKLRESAQISAEYTVYEADLDIFRRLLSEYKVNSAPQLVLLEEDSYKVLDDVRFDNLSQILSSEI